MDWGWTPGEYAAQLEGKMGRQCHRWRTQHQLFHPLCLLSFGLLLLLCYCCSHLTEHRVPRHPHSIFFCHPPGERYRRQSATFLCSCQTLYSAFAPILHVHLERAPPGGAMGGGGWGGRLPVTQLKAELLGTKGE